ncbi:flagellar hook-associated protein FlgK [Pontivivens ytuae]|uniref:Flagellar hook-associated protein 1 n=1 Tax=Pontivivens ytuae TaxID=2789856 RepID=A0A7S9LQH7_9RHOB|nr:flagellar hook-associated protein FlgK [Pontivivens ytuae]QPH53110.1 flagellar hook-associated protein FlgK [Pontivivens ytuae]
MSISAALASARSGLAINARAAELVSTNVANALTPGYARQELDRVPRLDGGVASGQVVVARDAGATALRLSADSAAEQARTGADALARVGDILGDPGAETGLVTQMTALLTSIDEAAATPENEALQRNVLTAAQDVASAFGDLSEGLRMARADADRRLGERVDALNGALEGIDKLNREITAGKAQRRDVSALEQERAGLVDEVALHVPVRIIRRDNDQIALFTPDGAALLDGIPARFEFTPTPVVTEALNVTDGTLGEVLFNGQPVTPSENGSLLSGGGLAADQFLRDTTLPRITAELDTLAAGLLSRLETADVTRAPGDAALLGDGNVAHDPLDTTGLAGRLEVNAVVDPAQGGRLHRIRDGVGATAPGAPGDAATLQALSAGLRQQGTDLATIGDPVSRSILDHAIHFAAALGSEAASAETDAAARTATLEAARTVELGRIGVDTDAELQLLLEIETAYAANARVLDTVDSMIRTLLEI